MTRAIDGLVNVDFADRPMPEWMVRVKEDYFKGGDSFFASPELDQLLDDMDAHGVERAILMCSVRATESRALDFARARPDRFSHARHRPRHVRQRLPVLTLERCIGEARALDLPDDVRDAWLYGNADAFFFGGG